MHAVAAEYPHSTLNGTLTCSSHSGASSYETQVADQEESGCVEVQLTYLALSIASVSTMSSVIG